jgi:hypothetical protein
MTKHSIVIRGFSTNPREIGSAQVPLLNADSLIYQDKQWLRLRCK